MKTLTLNDLKRFLEKTADCDSRIWNSLVNCNLPKNRKGDIPLLIKAMSKNVIPQEYTRTYFNEIKRQEEEIREKGFKPLFLILSGDIGNYKTLMGVKYLAIKTVTEKLYPLFLTNDELLGLYNGSLELQQFTDDITYAVETKITPSRTHYEFWERIPFTAITKFYDIIMIDDLEEDAVPALEKLILQAYDTETFIIVTTNIAPPSKFIGTEDSPGLLSEKAISRLLECGIAVHVVGTDKRRGGRDE
ncbi:hypothetical protein SAMN06269117_11448 [Balnearium lithotrophicum]|uniref:Uncharacterized protein n=1 Tax=Balnearium lithotrophicum TaxID=223788 RepID=A0A521CSJ6_9BACT|nr:hypothetical protein [Balnearium lithotrophicum]SMO61620.1 hypothetical protein SAMN06269117_11448 [Balnearium lithotrophicum]